MCPSHAPSAKKDLDHAEQSVAILWRTVEWSLLALGGCRGTTASDSALSGSGRHDFFLTHPNVQPFLPGSTRLLQNLTFP